MFSGNLRFLLLSMGIMLLLWLVSEFKVFMLVLSWIIIAFCTWVLYVKTHSRNKRLRERLERGFRAVRNSRIFKFLSGRKKPRDKKG
jgi:Flp pilus assembly protein TadB